MMKNNQKKKILFATIILLNISIVIASSIWTTDSDGLIKLDFAPEETVYIHGTEFQPGQLVTINVTRPDSVVDTGYGMTDYQGAFLYNYLLDGITGTYYVSATDGTSTAETIFNDSKGAIWTTKDDCGDETQDENHFKPGDKVYINGNGFSRGTYSWSIEGKPGGASCDPGAIVASGTRYVGRSGSFCFSAYTVLPDDCGEYQVKFGTKGDNYQVDNNCGDGVCNEWEIINYNKTPDYANIDGGTDHASYLTYKDDGSYFSVDVNTNTHYLYMTWLIEEGLALDGVLDFRFKEDSGRIQRIDWWDGDSWEDTGCGPYESDVWVDRQCGLDFPGIIQDGKVRLRMYLVKDVNCHVYVDYAKLNLVYTNCPEDCGPCVDDSDCDHLDNDYCAETVLKHDEGICVQGVCEVETTGEECYYYNKDCSGTQVWVWEGYCDDTNLICADNEYGLEDCYREQRVCDDYDVFLETGICDLGECSSELTYVETCSGYHEYCSDNQRWYYDDICLSGYCQDDGDFIEDCDDYYSKYCSDDYTWVEESGTCVEDFPDTMCAPASSTGDCRNELWCDGLETCESGGCVPGTPVDCHYNDLIEIAQCDFDPDKIYYTWDYAPGFKSMCDEENDMCTSSCYSFTHTCADDDIYDTVPYGGCSAECDEDVDCEDKCVGDVYYYNGWCELDSVCECNYDSENCDKDGCYDYESGCEDRDYYCSLTGCEYDYYNRDEDSYDNYEMYCLVDEVWTKRLFHDYYCDTTCQDHTSFVDDSFVEDCNDRNNYYCSADLVMFEDWTCDSGSCKIDSDTVVEDCNVHDYYGNWEYYCKDDDVWKRRMFYDYSCEIDDCYLFDSYYVEDQLVEDCYYEDYSCLDDSVIYEYGYCDLGSCQRDSYVTKDCNELDSLYCNVDILTGVDGYCSDGVCETKTDEQNCYYYDQYCMDTEVWYTEGFCNVDFCDSHSGFVEECFSQDYYCDLDEVWVEEGYCSSGTCTKDYNWFEDCKNDYEFCSGDERWTHDEYCVSGSCDYDEWSLDDCSDYNNKYCSDLYNWVEETYTCIENNPVTYCAPSSSTGDCSDGLWCNGEEVCEGNGVCVPGTDVDCSVHNLPEIGECNHDPDLLYYTWDFALGFTSWCDEDLDACRQGQYNFTHTCADNDLTDTVPLGGCNAECDEHVDCPNKCVNDMFYYGGLCDLSNSCTCDYDTEDCDKDDCYVFEDGCEDRNYYCTLQGCAYDYYNRNTDYYDGFVDYCLNDEIWEHRLFHDYYCNGACSDHATWADESRVYLCNDDDGWYDTGNTQWVIVNDCTEKEQKEQEYRDYYCAENGEVHCAYQTTNNQWVDTGNYDYYKISTPCEADQDLCTIDHCNGEGNCVTYDNVFVPPAEVCKEYYCDPSDGLVKEDYSNYPWSTPCQLDDDVCTIDHCDGLGTCIYWKDYDDNLSATTIKSYGMPSFVEESCALACNYDEECMHANCKWWINSSTLITLTAIDEGMCSEIDTTYYRVTLKETGYCDVCSGEGGEGSFEIYTGPFTIPDDSCHLIEYYSTDSFGNQEEVKHQCVYVDNQPPTPNKIVGEPKIAWDGLGAIYYDLEEFCAIEGNCWNVTKDTQIILDCVDEDPHPVGVDSVCFKLELDGDDYTSYYCSAYNGEMSGDYCCADSFDEFYFLEDSEHNLKYYCVDKLGNKGEIDDEKFKVEGDSLELHLCAPMSLFSVPFNLLDNSVSSVFEGVDVNSVWTYDNGVWFVWTPDESDTDSLTSILPGWGYLVQMDDDITLTLGGSLFREAVTPPSKKLVEGWNLIGYYGTEFPEFDEDIAFCALNSLVDTKTQEQRWNVLYGFDSCNGCAVWDYMGGCDFMRSGQGYFIHLTVDESYSPSSQCITSVFGCS